MKRSRCGKRMGHRRVRKIDFTVNLIYLLFSRCPVSIKPAHKQVLSSSIFGSTPSNHCCALTGNTRINISGWVQTISDYPKSFVMEFNRCSTQKNWKTMSRSDNWSQYALHQCLMESSGGRHNEKMRIWKCGFLLWFALKHKTCAPQKSELSSWELYEKTDTSLLCLYIKCEVMTRRQLA